MLHPSYTDLMNAVNSYSNGEDEPTINSRYSIVIATSRRARQIIDEQENKEVLDFVRPLSTAVEELNNGSVKIVSEDDYPEEEIDLDEEILLDEDFVVYQDDDEEMVLAEPSDELQNEMEEV